MKNSPSVSQLGDILAGFLRSYHVIIYSLTIVIGVSIAVLLLSSLVTLSGTAGETTQKAYPIDQETIKQVDTTYQSRSESLSKPFNLESGRINPFVE